MPEGAAEVKDRSTLPPVCQRRIFLGRGLGCLGHVARLRRLWAGPFSLEHAVPLEAVGDADALAQIDRQLASERRRLETECDEKKEKVRQGT